jgi:very-short-patch-repair endonuclease
MQVIQRNGKHYKQGKHRLSLVYENTCIECTKQFFGYSKSQMYCSLSCNYKHKQKNSFSICPTCHKEFIKNNLCETYCSRECFFRGIRNKETTLETSLYLELDKLNLKYEKYKKVMRCFPDAFVADKNLCLFADGSYWHSLQDRKERDERITRDLINSGYNVIRVGETKTRKLDVEYLRKELEYYDRGKE